MRRLRQRAREVTVRADLSAERKSANFVSVRLLRKMYSFLQMFFNEKGIGHPKQPTAGWGAFEMGALYRGPCVYNQPLAYVFVTIAF